MERHDANRGAHEEVSGPRWTPREVRTERAYWVHDGWICAPSDFAQNLIIRQFVLHFELHVPEHLEP